MERQAGGGASDGFAVNNLGRMVRMQIAAGQRMPGYEQEEWVAVQHYQEREWKRGGADVGGAELAGGVDDCECR